MDESMTPDRMVSILKLPNSQAESVLFERLRHLDRTTKLGYAEVGLICRAVQDFLLHEHRLDENGKPCSLSKWIRLAAPWSYSTAFSAMRDVQELADIPDAQLAEIPQSNFPTLKQLSTKVRAEPAVLEAAKTQPNEQFVEQIQKDYPEQHVEAHKTLKFTLDESSVALVNRVLKKAEGRGAHSRSEALFMIAVEIEQQWELEDSIEEITSNVQVSEHP